MVELAGDASVVVLKEELHLSWVRELDLNQRPSAYGADELPNCSIPYYMELAEGLEPPTC